MSNTMPKSSVKINKKRIKALERRITRKDLAESLGISESTLYRYASGKVKNPKIDINQKVDNLWDSFKTKKPTKNNNLKHKRAEEYKGYSFAGKKHYEKMNSNDYVYRISSFDPATIEDTIDYIHSNHPGIKIFQAKLVGINEHGKTQRFSTPLFIFQEIDGLLEAINGLLAKPSKTLKSMIHLEIIGKEYK